MGLKTKGLLDTQVLVKNPTKKAGEMMSWWLRVLPALPEDPALVPSTHANPRHCEGARGTARPWVGFPRFPLEASSPHSFLTDPSFLCVQFSNTNTSCFGGSLSGLQVYV